MNLANKRIEKAYRSISENRIDEVATEKDFKNATANPTNVTTNRTKSVKSLSKEEFAEYRRNIVKYSDRSGEKQNKVVPTVEILKKCYEWFNSHLFGGKLPKTSNVAFEVKMFPYDAFSVPTEYDKEGKPFKFKIGFNDCLFEEFTLYDSIIHEMIHIEDNVVNYGKSKRMHDLFFMNEVKRLNSMGWHIGGFSADSAISYNNPDSDKIAYAEKRNAKAMAARDERIKSGRHHISDSPWYFTKAEFHGIVFYMLFNVKDEDSRYFTDGISACTEKFADNMIDMLKNRGYSKFNKIGEPIEAVTANGNIVPISMIRIVDDELVEKIVKNCKEPNQIYGQHENVFSDMEREWESYEMIEKINTFNNKVIKSKLYYDVFDREHNRHIWTH